MVVKVQGSVNPDGRTGQADSVSYDDDIEGAVANLATDMGDPGIKTFTIMGVPVRASSTSTNFEGEDDPGFSFDTIMEGDVVEVSGEFNGDVLVASYIEKQDALDDVLDLLDLGHRLGLPGMVAEDGSPAFRDYADYIVHHQRKPGVGPLAGWRGAEGDKTGVGAPNPGQLDRYIANGAFCTIPIAPEYAYYKHANRGYLDWAVEIGFRPTAAPTSSSWSSSSLSSAGRRACVPAAPSSRWWTCASTRPTTSAAWCAGRTAARSRPARARQPV